MLLGCIADDLTGATDLGVNLAREGLSVLQINGVPAPDFVIPDADVVVVALKSRTIAPEEAVAMSLASLAWLLARGAPRIYFKYCSTFDSTPRGNIGPVTDALRAALDAEIVPATPAYPRNQRTVYLGHLFVGDLLLSETGMRNHPLTPMRDANLVRVLGEQTAARVGLVAARVLDAGADAVRERLAALAADGVAHAIIDATRDDHLTVAGAACADLRLTTGGAGLAVGLARALRSGALAHSSGWSRPKPRARTAWLSGSCSEATRAQVAAALTHVPGIRVDPLSLAADPKHAAQLAAAAVAAAGTGAAAGAGDGGGAGTHAVGGARPDDTNGAPAVFVYATADPDAVAAAQAKLGIDRAATLIEDAFRVIAQALAAAGVQAFVVAGGETSGAVVEALGVKALAIGPEIDPGVPWTRAVGGPPLWLALKSGNFGTVDFFARATAAL